MSLTGRPIGRTDFFSNVGAGTANTLFVETAPLPPGWYLVEFYSSSTDTALFANLGVFVGSTPWGILPTPTSGVVFVAVMQLEGARAIRLVSQATTAGGKLQVATISVTPIEPPPNFGHGEW